MTRISRSVLALGLSILGTSICAVTRAADQSHQVETLENGLEFVALEARKVPLVTIVLAVKAGAFTETPQNSGLTHLWEHMFFKGNAAIPNQEAFHEKIRDLGIIYNGDTHPEMVRYYFTLPSAFLEEGLEFMFQAITSPLIDEKELLRERRVVLDEFDRNASQIGFDLYRMRQRSIYGKLAYLRNPLGERSLIENASRKQLMQIKDQVFVPKNSALLIAGDFDKPEAAKLVKRIFNPWQNPKNWQAPRPPAFPAFPQKPLELISIHPQARNVSISMVFEGPKARSQGKDAYIADVLSGLVNHRLGGFVKRYIDSGITYGASFGYLTQAQAGELSLSALTSPANFKQLRADLQKETQRWTEEGAFTEAQLEDVRRSLRIQRAFEENRPSEYVKNIAFWWAITNLSFYNDYIESLRKISLVEVKDFIRRYLIGRGFVTSILLSPEDAAKLDLKPTAPAK